MNDDMFPRNFVKQDEPIRKRPKPSSDFIFSEKKSPIAKKRAVYKNERVNVQKPTKLSTKTYKKFSSQTTNNTAIEKEKNLAFEDYSILGIVKKILAEKVIIDLPKADLEGYLLPEDISDEFLSENETSSGEKVNHKLEILGKILKVGQFVPCIVLNGSNDSKLSKNIKLSTKTKVVNSNLKKEHLVPETIVWATVSNIEDHGAIVRLDIDGFKGFVSWKHSKKLKNDLIIGTSMFYKILQVNEATKIVEMTNDIKKCKPKATFENIQQVKPGDKIDATINEISDKGMKCNIGVNLEGFLDVRDMNISPNSDISTNDKYKKGLVIMCCVLEVDAQKNLIRLSNRKNVLKMKYKNDSKNIGKMLSPHKILSKINDVMVLEPINKNESIEEKLTVEFSKKDAFFSKFVPGDAISCKIKAQNPFTNNFVITSHFLTNDLEPTKNYFGIINNVSESSLTILMGNFYYNTYFDPSSVKRSFKLGEKIEFRVLSVKKGHVTVSVDEMFTKDPNPLITSIDDIKVGMKLTGLIRSNSKLLIGVKFYNFIIGRIPMKNNHKLNKYCKKVCTENKVMEFKVERKSDQNILILSIDNDEYKKIVKERKENIEKMEKAALKEVSAKSKSPQKSKSLEKKDLKDENGLAKLEHCFSSDVGKSSAKLGFGFDEFEANNQTNKSASDANSLQAESSETTLPQKRRSEEMSKDNAIENRNGKSLPKEVSAANKANEFEKSVLTQPNDSFVWLQYIAFHLGYYDVASARAVAERALARIPAREEDQRFNIWIGFMNMEIMFGTNDSLKDVFDRACQNAHPKRLHLKLAEILEKAGKMNESKDILLKALSKFKSSKKVWMAYLRHLIAMGNVEESRAQLKRCLQSLDKHKHVLTITKYASDEYQFGSKERGRNIFEGMLTNYPKRHDLWTIYIDREVKSGNIDAARKLYERFVNSEVKPGKMKSRFKKYLDFEMKYGDESSVEHVKAKARLYVQSIE